MLFSNKWANLLFILALVVVGTMFMIKHAKVLDAAGKDTGDHLGYKAAA